jgi:hypothetical protein
MVEPGSEGDVNGKARPAEARTEPRGSGEILRPGQHLSAFEKTMGVLRTILPIAQKVLPLIDGQIGTVVSNFLGPQASPRQVAQTLLQLQEGLAQLEKQHMELRAAVAGQIGAFKQIDERLEAVRKLTEETAERQRKLAESLEKTRRKVNVAEIAGLVLLTAVVALNVVLFVQMRRMSH